MFTEITNARGSVNGLARANLNARFEEDETAISNIKTEVQNARKYKVWNDQSEQWVDIDHTSIVLKDRLDNIDDGKQPSRTLPEITNEIDAAHRVLTGGEADTLKKRFDSIDGNTVPTRTLPSVIQEIYNAHRTHQDSNANPPTVEDTLSARFMAID